MSNFYVVINSNIISMKQLTDSDKIIYSIICNLTDKKTGISNVMNSYIFNNYGYNERTIQRALKRLELVGLIEIEVITNNKRKIKVLEQKLVNQLYSDINKTIEEKLFEYDWLNEKEEN